MPAPQLPAGTHLAYVVDHHSWWWPLQPVHERQCAVMIMASGRGSGGGIAWEFAVTEHTLLQPTPYLRLGMFDHAWPAFTQIPDLFTALAAGSIRNLDALCRLLDEMGAINETDTVNPATAPG